MSEEKQTCDDCRFWCCEIESRAYGTCRRYAPRARVISEVKERLDWKKWEQFGVAGSPTQGMVEWPDTTPDDWCGEWERTG